MAKTANMVWYHQTWKAVSRLWFREYIPCEKTLPILTLKWQNTDIQSNRLAVFIQLTAYANLISFFWHEVNSLCYYKDCWTLSWPDDRSMGGNKETQGTHYHVIPQVTRSLDSPLSSFHLSESSYACFLHYVQDSLVVTERTWEE